LIRLAVIVLVLGTVWVTQVPWQEYIAIREITVKGGERIQAETVLQRFSIQVGMNWLTADTQAARQALLRLPDIREAHVARLLWGRVQITLTERKPLAIVQLKDGTVFWLDTEGFLFQSTKELFGPVIVEPETIETDYGVRLADLFSLVPIGVLMTAPGGFLNRIHTVRFEGSTMVLSMRDGPSVWLNAYDLKRELPRLQRVLQAFAGRHLQTVDLRFERLVVVRRTR
jgi:cell division protein FtsQ